LSFVFATITQRHTLIQPLLFNRCCDQEWWDMLDFR
jgi:hypothetical protein